MLATRGYILKESIYTVFIISDYSTGQLLVKSQEIKVVGASHKRGYLQVEHGAKILQVPYQLTDIQVGHETPRI